jgi:hypothetical protein
MGTIAHATFAHNAALFSAAIASGNANGNVTVSSSLFAYSVASNGFNPISCNYTLASGGNNMQWPVARSGGDGDDPNALCAPGITVADPLLGPLQNNGGPVPTLLPLSGSPAVGLGAS